ncbi:MAG TPA: hypothetical protein V6D48_05070 [Oculatellaceae cyanobacterium]
MGVLLCCYSDILASTTRDRFDGKFFPWLVVACVEEATKTPHRRCQYVIFTVRISVVAVLRYTVMGHSGIAPIRYVFFSFTTILSVYLFGDRSRGRI